MNEKLIIVVVDDSKVIVDRLLFLLDELPINKNILIGKDYLEGYQLLSENEPHIAIIDVFLPDGTGIDLLKHIKKQKKDIKKIIIMTNDPTEEEKSLSLSMGADYFLNKYEEFEKIKEIIEAFYNNDFLKT